MSTDQSDVANLNLSETDKPPNTPQTCRRRVAAALWWFSCLMSLQKKNKRQQKKVT